MTALTFPSLVGLEFPVLKSPIWSTIENESISGKTTRISLYTYPKYRISLSFSYLGSGIAGQNQDYQTLIGFYNRCGGKAKPFRWTDPYDNTATAQSLGIGDGATTQFLLVRTLGGFVEPAQDVSAISQVTVAGTPTAAYTQVQDPNFGLVYAINFNSPPANGAAIAASFTYNWPCRFDDDSVEFSNDMQLFWSLRKLSFTTLKVV
jgi:uncharacterized protein (TIGR02217 family)